MTDIWIKRYQKQALPKLKEEFNPEKLSYLGQELRVLLQKIRILTL